MVYFEFHLRHRLNKIGEPDFPLIGILCQAWSRRHQGSVIKDNIAKIKRLTNIMKIPSTEYQISNKYQRPKFKNPNKGFGCHCTHQPSLPAYQILGSCAAILTNVLVMESATGGQAGRFELYLPC